jgi:protein-L-isoaspartate(D-aspartate) O-methyltransferase
VELNHTFPQDPLFQKRQRMVRDQIERRGLKDRRVLAAMRAVPRHHFLFRGEQAAAYDDTPLPIGCHQTISQPYIVAYMTAALELQGSEKVLEIGTGTGYQTTILACLAQSVYSIERVPELAERARNNLRMLNIDNADVAVGDGTLGCPERSPFDAVMITAGAPSVPQPLLDQLAPGGRLLAPVGGRNVQELELWTRTASGFAERRLISVVFVPLIGTRGWNE